MNMHSKPMVLFYFLIFFLQNWFYNADCMIAFVYKSLYVIFFFFCIHSIKKKRLYLYQYFISRLWIISGLYKKGENIGCFSLSSSFAWSVALTVLHWFCCQSSMFTALFTHVTLAFLSWRGFIGSSYRGLSPLFG